MKKNWLVTSGFSEITETEIKYIPKTIKDELNEDRIVNSIVSTDIEFENGTIEFEVQSKDIYGICQLILNSDTGPDLNVGLNTSGYLYGIVQFNRKTNKWELLKGVGEQETFDTSKFYKLKITVTGSIISLFVNGILIASAIENVRKGQLQIAFSSRKEIIVKNFKVNLLKPKAFIVMQFTEDYNQLYTEVIKPVCESYGLEVERADEFYTATPIIKDIVKSIKNASVIIAEITPDNPNVFYEVGYAHAIEKPTILLSDIKRDKLPFDISGFRTLFYENTIAGKTKVERNLKKFLENIF
ncbi:TIR domain-containing protein [Hanstruepera ponticola]|uniref:hypothetical protein n=1 Tax=Hanstruepera ponticola TaxID=2042995 RepID=UPI00177DDC70|nr:hypothetical protein [Hanstruepera ponticola]